VAPGGTSVHRREVWQRIRDESRKKTTTEGV
jgi:sRNA-binding carbon storage regulator CsrA